MGAGGERGAKLETYLRVLAALHEARGGWVQGGDLAARAGVQNRTANQAARAWERAGVPVVSQGERGTVLRWKLSAEWVPGGVLLGRRDAHELLKVLMVTARSLVRAELLARIVEARPEVATVRGALDRVVAPVLHENEANALGPVLDALGTPPAVITVRYYSAHDRRLDSHTVSPQRLMLQGAMQLLAVDHATGTARRFRMDRIERVERERYETWRAMDEREIASHEHEAFDGWCEPDGRAWDVAFRVRAGTWAWARGVFPATRFTEARDGDDWTRVAMRTRGLTQLAAFLVGLGEAVRAESDALRSAMVTCARGSLAANEGQRDER